MDYPANEIPALIADDDSVGTWLKRNGVVLVVLLALVGVIAYKGWNVTSIGLVLVGLGFVIFVHELGHFLAAKACDVCRNFLHRLWSAPFWLEAGSHRLAHQRPAFWRLRAHGWPGYVRRGRWRQAAHRLFR